MLCKADLFKPQLSSGGSSDTYEYAAGIVQPPAGDGGAKAHSIAAAQSLVRSLYAGAHVGLAYVLERAGNELRETLVELCCCFLAAHAQTTRQQQQRQQQQERSQQQQQQQEQEQQEERSMQQAWSTFVPMDPLFGLISPSHQVQLLADLVMAMCLPERSDM